MSKVRTCITWHPLSGGLVLLVAALVLACLVGQVALAQEIVPPVPQPSVESSQPATLPAALGTTPADSDLAQRVRALEEQIRRLNAPPLTPKPFADLQTETFEARWRNAFVIQSPDERFRLRVGGLVQADGRYFVDRTDPPPADAINQFLLRRARIDIEADAWRYFAFRLQPDFAGGNLVLYDAYADVKVRPELRFRFGKFKVPFGLERLQPANSIIFLERAFPTDISPNRDLGVQISGDVAGAILSYAVGVFNGNASNTTTDGALGDQKEVAGRLSMQPFSRLPIAALTGLGIAGAFTYGLPSGNLQNPNLGGIRTDGQSQIFSFVSGMTLSDTVIAAGTQWRASAQGNYYYSRFGLLGEFVHSQFDMQKGATQGTGGMDAWQAEATLLLTADRASYTGVVPHRPFDPFHGSWGAVELAARAGALSIGDSVFSEGFADPKKAIRGAFNWVLGCNWYFTANTRMVFDYSYTSFTGGASTGAGDRGAENVLAGRMQFAM